MRSLPVPALVSLCWLSLFPLAVAEVPAPPSLPPVVARYETMLAGSPGKGTAFDKVYQYALENGGLDALATRWRERAAADDVFFLLDGLLSERRARPGEAREDYARFTAAHPADPRGWTALGELETAEGRFKESADALARALGPGMTPPVPANARPGLFRALARAQTRDFQTEPALATWRQLQAEFPGDATVLEEVGEALSDAGAFDEARGTFERLRELARKNGDSFGRLTASLRLGQVEERRGKAAEAVGVYEEVVAGAKAGSWLEREARARIEGLYRGQEDLPGLADYYKKWLGDHPKDLDVATRRAAVLVELNRRAEAIDLLQAAVGWAPDRQDLPVELARRLAEAGRPAEAIQVLEKLTAAAPEEKSYWVMLGDARWQAMEETASLTTEEKTRLRAGALEAWRQLAPVDAKDAGAVGRLADLFANHRLTAEALAEHERAARLAPDLPDARERWAAYLAQLNRRDEARTVLAGIVEGRNATAANFARLANGLRRLDDAPGALAAADRGLEREPANFDLLSLRWQLLTEAKRWDEALGLYERLLAAAPGWYFAEQVQARHVGALASAGKLEDARKALAARVGSGPPLAEAELALLTRIDLQGTEDPDFAVAARALAEGRARFSRSAVLARLEGERARRRRDTDGQVAALRRLIEIQPARRADALREIARACQDGGRPAEALAAAGELIEAAPANAASHLFLADLLFEDARPADAVTRLQTAVRLSDRPNDVRLRLARALTELGQEERARGVYDEAFEAAGDPRERLQLMKPLAESYLRAGKLDELIERFTRRQQAEGDGWRYALYLAEIYQQTQNLAAARRELGKALAARPKDTALLRQLIRLATEEGNGAEVARCVTLLAEAEPSDTNGLALVQALLENDQPAEALAALRPRLAAITKIPGALDGLLPLLAKHDLTAKVGDLLAEQFGADAGAKGRLALALFQAMAGQNDAARAALWAIFDGRGRDPSAPAPAPPAPPVNPNNVSSLYRLFSGGDSAVDLRVTAAQQTRQTAQGLLDGSLGNNGGNARFYARGARVSNVLLPGNGGGPAGVDPADAARDSALVYLAALAVKDKHANQFLAELDQHLAARNAGPVDRLVAYAAVDAREGLIREILSVGRGPEPEPGVDQFCLSRLLALSQQNDPRYRRFSQEPALSPAESEEILRAAETFFRRVAAASPSDGVEWSVARFAFYHGLGRRAQADAAREELLTAAEQAGATAERVIYGLSILLMPEAEGGEAGELSAAEVARLRRITDSLARTGARPSPGGMTTREFQYLPMMLVQGESRAARLSPEDFAEVFASLLSAWYPTAPAGGGGVATGSPGRLSRGNGAPNDPSALPDTSYFEATALQLLQNGVQAIKSGDAGAERLDALRVRLDAQAATFPDARKVYPRLTRVYLDAWTDHPEPALAAARRLTAENPADPDLRQLVASLLARNGQPAAAIAALEALPARPGDAGIALQRQILTLAKEAKDNEAAKRAALRLAALRLPSDERQSLAEELRALGLTEKADALLKSAGLAANGPATRSRGSNPAYEKYQRLQQLNQAKDETGAVALARNILDTLQPPGPGQANGRNNEEFVLRQAVQTLREKKAFDAFIADSERQLAGDPDSARLLFILASALSAGDNDAGRQLNQREFAPTNGVRGPVWMRLTRTGAEVVGAWSKDGVAWTELGRATVDLGSAPLVALSAVGGKNLKGAAAVVATFDEVRPGVDGTAESPAALPAPWHQSELPPDPPPAANAPAPPNAYGREGAFTVRGGAGELLAGARDTARLVWRPLGDGAEVVALLSALSPGEDSYNTFAGLLLRADLSPDAPTAAVLARGNSGVAFIHRDRRDPSVTYWRKLAALRPREPAFPRALAARLLARGEPSAAVEIYGKLLASDPDTTFTAQAAEVVNAYRAANRFPEFVGKLLAWKPGPANPNNPYRYNLDQVFIRTAEQCVDNQQPDLAVALCRRGLELDPGHDSQALHQRLIKTLADADRRDEARTALVDLYCPPPDNPAADPAVLAANSPPALGFRAANAVPRPTNNGRPAWMNSTSSDGDGNVTLPALDLLDTARRLELLPDLIAACEQRLTALTAAAAPAGTEEERRRSVAGLRSLLTILRIDARDPRAEADLPAVLAPDKGTPAGPYVYHDQGDLALRMTLARRLRTWPGHEAGALEALHAARRMADESRQSLGYFRVNLLARQAVAELELGSRDVAVATLREWAKSLEPTPQNGNRFDVGQAESCLRLMLRLPECDEDFLNLLARARRTEDGKRLAFNYDLERAAREGNAERYQPLAWLLDENANPGAPEATLVCEIRPEHPFDKAGEAKFLFSRGRSMTGSERERTLLFAYGKDPANLTPIGRLATRETLHTWTGPIPAGTGFLKVSLEGQPDAPPTDPGKAPADQPPGYWIRVLRAPNLVTNPALDGLAARGAGDTFTLPGWPDLPAGFWRIATEGGPLPGRPFIQCEVERERPNAARGNASPGEWREIAAAPVPLEPGREYLQAVWVREVGPNSTALLARRYLDKDGRVLKTTEAPNFTTLTWRRAFQRLAAKADNGADAIPAGAVSVVPVIKVKGAVEWAGVYLGMAE